jgi:hypothetical protein
MASSQFNTVYFQNRPIDAQVAPRTRVLDRR